LSKLIELKTFLLEKIGGKFFRHVGLLTVANLLGAVLSLAQGILVARWLGAELYGTAALVMSYPGLVYTFFDARSSQASVKYLSEFHAQEDKEKVLATCKLGYTIDGAIALIACLVIFVTAKWAALNVVHNPEVVGLIIVYGAAFIPRGLVGTSRAVFSTLGKFPLMAGLDALTTCLRVVLVLALVLSGWQVAGVVWGNAIAMVGTGLIYGVMGWREIRSRWGQFPIRGKWQALKVRQREILSFLGYSNLDALVGMLPKQLDVLLLGFYRNPTEVGYYQLAKRLVNIASYLVSPLQSVTYPQLSRLWIENKEALRQRVGKLALQIGLPLGLTLLLTGTMVLPAILPVLFGEDYIPAIAATQILLVATAIWLMFFWLRPLYLTMDKIKVWTLGIGVYSSIFIVLSFPITINYGYLGLSYWRTISTMFFYCIMISKLFFKYKNEPNIF